MAIRSYNDLGLVVVLVEDFLKFRVDLAEDLKLQAQAAAIFGPASETHLVIS